MDGPSKAEAVMAKIKNGKLKKTSARRIIKTSIRPPKYPAKAPSTRPILKEIDTDTKPTDSEILPPYRVRAKMSRPISSVPNQCSAEGGWLRARKSARLGSYGVSQGAHKASKEKQTSTIRPTRANLFALNRRQTARPGDSIAGPILSWAASSTWDIFNC